MTNTTTAISDMGNMAQLQARAHALRLTGLLAYWDQLVCDSDRMAWVGVPNSVNRTSLCWSFQSALAAAKLPLERSRSWA
jgi:hypothetical protein